MSIKWNINKFWGLTNNSHIIKVKDSLITNNA